MPSTFFERLIDRHRADGNRRIAHDPFARVVDVATRREVHDIVGAPADRPDHLVDLFGDRRGDGGIADIGIDLHEEIAADDHRLEFRVIDVRRDDGAAGGDFVAHEFRRDEFRNIRAEALALGDAMRGIRGGLFAAHVLTLGDEGHLGGDDAGLRELILRDRMARQAAARTIGDREGAREMFFADIAVVFRLHLAAVVKLGVPTRLDPGFTVARQTRLDIDLRRGIGVGARRVVDADRRLIGSGMQRDLAERHFEVGETLRARENLGARGKRPGGNFRELALRCVNIHHGSPLPALMGPRVEIREGSGGGGHPSANARPFAGMTRIRF